MMTENKLETKLETIMRRGGLEPSQSQMILDAFQQYFEIAAQWELYARSVVVKDENDKAMILAAKEGRKKLSEKRIAIEETRKRLKEKSLKEGQCIDGIAKTLKALIEPLESYLRSQEDFVEIKERERKNIIRENRFEKIKPYLSLPCMYDFANMDEEIFNALFEAKKKECHDKIEAEQALLRQREAKAKQEQEEIERIKAENAQLQAKRVEMEKLEAAARQESELRQKAEAQVERLRQENEVAAKSLYMLQTQAAAAQKPIEKPVENKARREYVTCPHCHKTFFVLRGE